MIKFEKAEVWGWEHAIRGMRNPLNSWDRIDSVEGYDGYILGENDIDLMLRLIKGGAPHRKFLRQIFVSVDITAPLYWWKEFDTYKVGTTANSCSTMHKLTEKKFERDDFSHEHLMVIRDDPELDWDDFPLFAHDKERWDSMLILDIVIKVLNFYLNKYIEAKTKPMKEEAKRADVMKRYWWQMIQLLPSSYNQKRTVTMTYENLLNILEYRQNHRLYEWRDMCEWITTLPNAFIIQRGVS